jgi:hypothetical protein
MPEITTTHGSRAPGIAAVLALLRDYGLDHVRMAGIAPGLEDRIWHAHAADASRDLAGMVEQLLRQPDVPHETSPGDDHAGAAAHTPAQATTGAATHVPGDTGEYAVTAAFPHPAVLEGAERGPFASTGKVVARIRELTS